ncbi:MAG: hypothetical protein U5O16_40895 [Rhodococcus sp. (in: high G+C Gram-positive bacteria)]|uniref:hypothetical protein n=1 Tax=Rhodococcus sp. TaxID=1831 RepID=UPI002AD694C7|nr:hypothetical protein [Rhodococcus sp. (in: high G+C Gram-positive bacteria)]
MADLCKRCEKKGCDAEITFALSSSTRKPLPLDRYPDPGRGTVRKVLTREHGEEVVYGQVLHGTALHTAVANGEQLYVIHFNTCLANRPLNPMPAHLRSAFSRPSTRPSRRRFR